MSQERSTLTIKANGVEYQAGVDPAILSADTTEIAIVNHSNQPQQVRILLLGDVIMPAGLNLPDDQKEHLEVWRCHRANPQAAEQARKWLRRVRSGDVTGSREAQS